MTVGTHRLERLLGRGGMGAVFLAYDTRLHRQVALKVLSGDISDETSSVRLLREARNAAALNHPNICTVHEVGEADGTAFIAMEYVGGRGLRDRIDDGPLSIADAVRLGMEAADALAHAHEHGVIHRDFKVANAILASDGRLKVVDFGLARRDDVRLADTITQASAVPAGALAGTPYAMAPEQVRGEPADARTDVWALGVFLYEIVTGAQPFIGQTVPELFSSILTKPPTPQPKVPTAIWVVIEKCLEKDPARRYQRAHDARLALEEIAAGTVTPFHVWSYQLRRRPVGAAVFVLAAVVAVVLGLNVAGVRDRLLGTPPEERPIRMVVLPFQNLTGDAAQEYFSDGLTDEMITQLGRLHPQRLSVIARTSAMRYKSRAVPIDQIGRELGVDYVMEGSARREGTRIRVNATLVRVADQSQLWSDSFDHELAGILQLQHDVARGVAGSLALRLLPTKRTELAQSTPVNAEAYEAYLKGQSHVQRLTRGDLDQAMEYFRLALEKDPNYARAHFGIGLVWVSRRVMGLISASEGASNGKAALNRALALDPALPEAHLAIANAYTWQDWNWAAAEPEYKRAIEVLPNDASARVFYGRYLNMMQRPEEAEVQYRRALELDPLSDFVRTMYGASLLHAGRYDDAIANAQRTLATMPNSPQALAQQGMALYFLGKFDESLAIDKQLQKGRGDLESLAAIDRGYGEAGYRGAMRQLADLFAARPIGLARVAGIYVRAGENDLALDQLERSFEAKDPGMNEIGVAAIYKDLRDHPRFQALLRKMNLPN